mgnify:CR=1 FL=1
MSTYKIAVSSMQLAGKLPPGDERWRDFNASFRNMEVLKSDAAAMIADGHAFTVWHRNQWRNAANYELGQHLALDFDAGNDGSSIPALMRDKFVQHYATYVYSTPSHTAEAPKSRVLFCLDTPIMQAKNYVLASRALLWLFGTADAKCKDAARFFYGSVNCEAVFVNRVLPLAKVREIIGQYIATGQEERRRHTVETPAEAQTFDGDADKLVRYWQRRMEGAREGERNDTLNKAAYSLGELVRAGVIRKHDVYNILEPAAVRAGLGKGEATGTIASGLRAWV